MNAFVDIWTTELGKLVLAEIDREIEALDEIDREIEASRPNINHQNEIIIQSI
jgi:hypothetical protein